MSGRALRRFALGGISLATTVVLLVVALPRTSHSSWDDVVEELPQVQTRALLLAAALWFVGLYAHTILLTGVLPGLRRRHAFALNLGGSCVSNVLPLGGAAGAALNWAMLSSWGFDRASVLTFTTTTNVIVAIVKVAIALAGLVALVTMPSLRGALPHAGAVLFAVLAALALVAVVALLIRHRGRRRTREGEPHRLRRAIREIRSAATQAVRTRWIPVAFGALTYPLLQLALLAACSHALALHLGLGSIAVAYAADRVLTLVPLTPGGAGFAETGMTAVLIAFGADPTASAAAVLLYRCFTYYIEIPLGGLVTLGWAVRRGARARTAV